jgi:hypothetical protein
MKALQNRLTTRDELGVSLPNLAYRPQTGVATSVQQKPTYTRSGQFEKIEQQVAGGVGNAAAAGDTQYVDDQGWDVNLKQLIGSRLLSREMLQKASIQNVSKLVNFSGGTPQQNEEMKYMFQRMMLEGFTRGVDITTGIAKGGLNVTIGNYETIGVYKSSGSKGTVIFKKDWWNGKSDADQYTLFVHELGHGVLGAHHENNRSEKKKDSSRVMTPIYAGSVLRNYDQLMDGLFNENTKSKEFKVQDFGKAATYEQNWFPPITGVSTTGTPITPQTDGTGTPNPDGVAPKTNTTNNYNFQPQEMMGDGASGLDATITAGGGGGRSAGMMANLSAPGQLSSDVMTPTKSFAAGMANLSQANAPDMGAAGALLKSG